MILNIHKYLVLYSLFLISFYFIQPIIAQTYNGPFVVKNFILPDGNILFHGLFNYHIIIIIIIDYI